MSKTEIQYTEIMHWLKRFCQDKKLGETYPGLEYSSEFSDDYRGARTKGVDFDIDPMLPIDLVAVRTVNESDEDKPGELVKVNYYTLFWVVSAEESDAEKLGVRLQYYQFLLSRVTDLKSVIIYLVLPNNIEKCMEVSLRGIAKEDGFGLLKMHSIQKLPSKPSPGRSFRDHMEKLIVDPPKDLELDPLPTSVKKNARKIGRYMDLFVREAIDAVAGRTPAQAGKRYIDRQLLENVFSIQHLSYATELKRMVTRHLAKKEDDYQFVEDTFSALWQKYFPKMEYTKFLRVSEFPLYHILAHSKRPYRDHYLHQFQVFLLGACILDKLLDLKHPDVIGNTNIDVQWLVTSSFHDMAYPLQLYEDWARAFFDESLNIPDLGSLDIRSYFVDRSLLSSTGFIVNALCEKHFNRRLEGNWLDQEKALILFFHDRISRTKHHCILSSLYLLKQAMLKYPEEVPNIFVPSALAIVLHHYEQVFKELKFHSEDKDIPWENLIKAGRVLKSIAFNADPLTCLLMLCDSAQEWGRPKLERPKAEDIKGDKNIFVLKQCVIQSSGCSITIQSPDLESIDPIFESKDNELTRLKKLLRVPQDFSFELNLLDCSGEPRIHRFKCIK